MQRATQAVNVCPRIDRVAVERLLRREIVRRAEHFLVMRHGQRILVLNIEEPGQAHVQEFDRAVGVNQQVRRLDVAVNESRSMSMLQPLGRLPDVLDRVSEIGGATADDQLLQALAVDVFHHQKMDLGVSVQSTIDVVRSHDIRMIDRGHRLSLTMKPRQVRRVVDSLGRQHLDRTAPLHQHMLGEVHRTHAPFAQ